MVKPPSNRAKAQIWINAQVAQLARNAHAAYKINDELDILQMILMSVMVGVRENGIALGSLKTIEKIVKEERRQEKTRKKNERILSSALRVVK